LEPGDANVNKKKQWLLSATISFLAALLFGVFGWQFRDWGLKIGASPQKLTAADLVTNGPADNHYVKVTDYERGEPIVESITGGGWVWIPIYPKGEAKAKGTPPIVFQVSGKSNEELETLRQRPPDVEGLVGNGIPALVQKASPTLLNAYPGLKTSQTWYIQVNDGPFRQMAYGLWIGAGVFALVATFSLAVGRGAYIPETADTTISSDAWAEGQCVHTFRGGLKKPPEEVAALGAPEYVYAPGGMLTLLRDRPIVFIVIGLLLIVAPLALVQSVDDKTWLFLSMIAGMIVLFAPQVYSMNYRPVRPTYMVFPDAFAIYQKGAWAIIHWQDTVRCDSSPGSLRDATLVLADGSKIPIRNERTNLPGLVEEVKSRLAGRKPEYGPVGIMPRSFLGAFRLMVTQGGVTVWSYLVLATCSRSAS
jgi:hypothetical protein